MGSAPADLEVYELALDLEIMPETVRRAPREDLYWLKTVKAARNLASAEAARRQAEKEAQEKAKQASADKGQAGE